MNIIAEVPKLTAFKCEKAAIKKNSQKTGENNCVGVIF